MPRKSYSRANTDDLGTTYWALVFSVIVTIILMFSQRDDASLRYSVQTQSDAVVSPLMTLVTKPVRGVETFFISMSDRQRAFEENVALRAELQNLREELSSLTVVQNKMERYEDILGARPDTDMPLRKLAARAVSDIKGPFVRALLINVGSKDGIMKRQAVMSPDGMVGHIILAGNKTSRVLRLDDLNSRIPVKSERSEAVAILAGDNSDTPKLMFIDIGKDWAVGDRVITSGDEGQLPRGLPVGEVIQGDDGLLRVKLTGMERPLDWVWIALFDPIQTPQAPEAAEDISSEGNLLQNQSAETAQVELEALQ